MKALFICASKYDFVDKDEKRITGVSAQIYLPDEKVVCKAQVKGNQDYYLNTCSFGEEVEPEVRVSGRYAKYILN